MSTLAQRGLPDQAARRPLPPLGERHERLRGEIRRFVSASCALTPREWEAERWFPDDVFTRMGELGLLGLKYPRR